MSKLNPMDNLRNALNKPTSNIPSIHYWSEFALCGPNEFFRAALISVKTRGKRTNFDREQMAVIGTGEVIYTGQELRAFDGDVWLHLIDLAKELEINEPVPITAGNFLREMGYKDPGGRHYNMLYESLDRLSATSLTIKSQRLSELPGVGAKGISTSLIQDFEFEEDPISNKKKAYKIFIGEKIRLLFSRGHSSHVRKEHRIGLSPIAKQLQGYYSSHKKPKDIKISTFRDWMNLDTQKSKANKKIINALNELENIGFLKSWQLIDKYLIRVIRN